MAENVETIPSAIVKSIVVALKRGEIVPFLGAGVNLCGRPQGEPFKVAQYLPSGQELAKHLAKEFDIADDDKDLDLTRIAEYVAVMSGTRPLYKELHKIFDADYPPTALHQLFASLPKILRDKKYPARVHNQLIVTTNYDDMLERALQQAGEPFDVVSYEAKESEHRGKFYHWPFEAKVPIPIVSANSYNDVSTASRTVILKLHGLVNRINEAYDSYVISEDDYINYLSRVSVSELLPATLRAKLKESSFLFLGYGLRDWNVRVILYWLWEWQELDSGSWALQVQPKYIDKKLWSEHKVDIIEATLENFVAELHQNVKAVTDYTG